MLLSFMIVLFWCVIYMFVGLIVLASVPALRVTLLNLIAFVIGALVGSTIFSIAYGQFHSPLDNYPDAIHFVGAVTGGIVLVWLKCDLVYDLSESFCIFSNEAAKLRTLLARSEAPVSVENYDELRMQSVAEVQAFEEYLNRKEEILAYLKVESRQA
jgi:hypothetical protein